MSKNSITIEGLKELQDSFNQAGTAINNLGRAYLKRWSDYGVKRVQINILNEGAVDTNELIQGIDYDLDGLVSTIRPSSKADKYAAAVEYGSRPHWPPIQALEGWAQRHGIPAFLVARKIAREGTKERPFWQPSYEELADYVGNDLDDFGDELLRKL